MPLSYTLGPGWFLTPAANWGYSFHDNDRGTGGQAPLCKDISRLWVIAVDIPLSKASHMAKHNFKGTEKYTFIMKVKEREYLLEKKSNLPFYFFYFR